VAIGAVTFFWRGITTLALVYLIAAFAAITGIFEFMAAVSQWKEPAARSCS
jgi:uncharacterized membrane protein HdeD (DUF308 family)